MAAPPDLAPGHGAMEGHFMDTGSRLAVVTGASSGIGAATAEVLAERGWRVVLVARSKAKLDDVARRIGQRGGTAIVEALDASDGAAVLEMARRLRAAHGVPDLVVNSAGAGEWKFIEETTPPEAIAMLQAPFLSAFNATHAFMADMLERRSGVVIHVGSPAAFFPWPGATGYTASRWALRGLHEALCQDLRGTGVSSCHVMFGKVSSSYFDHNPTAGPRIPGIARIIPTLTPQQCASIIARVAERPARNLERPMMLRLIYLTGLVVPFLVRWLIGRTGTRHAT